MKVEGSLGVGPTGYANKRNVGLTYVRPIETYVSIRIQSLQRSEALVCQTTPVNSIGSW